MGLLVVLFLASSFRFSTKPLLSVLKGNNLMQRERRSAPRVQVNLPARWEGILSRQEATITDLSIDGCYVLSGGKVECKEVVRLEIIFPDQDPIYFWAEVVEEAEEIGFGARFTVVDVADKERLEAFISKTQASMK